MANALQKLQDKSSYSNQAGEKIDWSYYDTITLISTTLVHRFFTVSLGQNGKTLADTNLVQSGLLPQGQNMKVHALKVAYVANSAKGTAELNTYFNLLNDTVIELIVPGKDSLGTWRLAEIMGINQLFPIIPTVAGDNISQPQPMFNGIFPLNIPWQIGAIQSFEVRLTHTVAVNAQLEDDKIVFMLNGRLIRMS